MRSLSRTLGLAVLTAIPVLLGSSVALAKPNYCDPTADNVVVYVDKTTPYDAIDKEALIDGVSRLFESLEGGERFSLHTIAQSATASETLLDECVPFCPDGGLLGDLFSDCTEGMVINDKKHLRESVVRELQALLEDFVELPNSDIVQTLAKRGAGEELRRGLANRLYLFTDLIENSVYMPGRDFFNVDNDELIAKLRADGLVPDFGGAVIKVFGVGRGGTAERRPLDPPLLNKLEDFWRRYFTAANATVTIQQSLGAV